jgi:hypothetical protein
MRSWVTLSLALLVVVPPLAGSRSRPIDDWRGVTAFALLEQVANGREHEAAAFMRWAADRGFNVVRVLGMAHHLFRLSPGKGVEAIPRLLRLANSHGLVVELVLFADTRSFRLDYVAHVDRVARAISGARNVVVELANENDHPTQDPRLTDPDRLRGLRARLPDDISVSLGSVHGGDLRVGRYGGGDFVTVHPSRSGTVWRHVSRTAALASLAGQVGRPVINDEPIGADERPVRGRRSNDPSVFFGLGLLARMSGVATTFHCEDCLRARRPGPTQDACAAAFIDGVRLLPEGGRFSLAPPAGTGGMLSGTAVAGVEAIHAATDASGEWRVVVALGAAEKTALPWAKGWGGELLARRPGVAVFRARPVRAPGNSSPAPRL